jgi:predicted component of type VI protein secretion system
VKAMTIDEAKKLLPPELKYPLPDDVIDNLINVQAIPLQFDFDEDGNNNKGMYYAIMAALIELKKRRKSEQSIYDKLQAELLDNSKGYLDYKAGYDDGIKKAIDILKGERGEDGK